MPWPMPTVAAADGHGGPVLGGQAGGQQQRGNYYRPGAGRSGTGQGQGQKAGYGMFNGHS